MSKSVAEAGDIERWLAKVKHAEGVRDRADKKYGYTRALQMYQGDFENSLPSFVSDVDIVPINEVYAFVKTFVPTILSRAPHLAANPRGIQSIAGAKIVELALNNTFRDLRLKRETRRVAVDAVLAEGVMKVGLHAANALGSIEKEDGEPSVEPNEFVKPDEIFATRISWKNFVRDPYSSNGLHDARWCAHRLILPIEAVKASDLYKNTKDLQPNFSVALRASEGPRRTESDETEEFVVIYEIWDRDSNKVYAMAEGHTRWLWEPKVWPYEMEGFPFLLMRFNENPDECYAPNLIDSWVPQLFEKMKIRALQLDHIKRFSRQLVVEKGVMTPGEKEKFRKGRTGALLEVKENSLAQSRGPQPIPYPQVQTDMYSVENRIDLDKDNVSGQPNAVRSAPQRTQSRTLGEIDRLVAAFQSRQADPQAVIEEFVEELGYKIIALMRQFLPEEKFVRASQSDINTIRQAMPNVRADGTGLWFSSEAIKDAEFEIEVRSGSTLPLDREGRIEAITSLLRVGQSVGMVPGTKLPAVLGKVLFEQFDMKELEVAYDEFIRENEAKALAAAAGQRMMADERVRQTQDIKARVIEQMQGGGPGAV